VSDVGTICRPRIIDETTLRYNSKLIFFQRDQPADDLTPINRREFILRLLSTSTDKELRCQVGL